MWNERTETNRRFKVGVKQGTPDKICSKAIFVPFRSSTNESHFCEQALCCVIPRPGRGDEVLQLRTSSFAYLGGRFYWLFNAIYCMSKLTTFAAECVT